MTKAEEKVLKRILSLTVRIEELAAGNHDIDDVSFTLQEISMKAEDASDELRKLARDDDD